MQRTLFTVLASALSVSHLATAGDHPRMTLDPNTIKSCIYFYDNLSNSQSCETIRAVYGISPEDFHIWNPSISVNCEGWARHSYCVAVDKDTPIHPVPSTTTSSTTRSVVWTDQSCFTDAATLHPLQTQLPSPAGKDLSRRKCENACWKAEFAFAALKAGVECWCGDYVNGNLTQSQDECNIPCPGNGTETCGGENAFNVLEGNLARRVYTTTPTLDTLTSTAEPWSSGVFHSDFFPSGVETSDVFGIQAVNTAPAGPSETSDSSAVNRLTVPYPLMLIIGCLGLLFG